MFVEDYDGRDVRVVEVFAREYPGLTKGGRANVYKDVVTEKEVRSWDVKFFSENKADAVKDALARLAEAKKESLEQVKFYQEQVDEIEKRVKEIECPSV